MNLALLIDRFMRRIHAALQAKASNFDPEGLGPGGGMILLALAEEEGIGMMDLARRVARDKSQMTRVIRAIEAKGLITRRGCPTDARASRVFLTEKGRETVTRFEAALTEAIDEILEPVSDADKAVLESVLKRALLR